MHHKITCLLQKVAESRNILASKLHAGGRRYPKPLNCSELQPKAQAHTY